MSRWASAAVWAIVGAVLFGGFAFGYLMLTGPAKDPSVYGTAMLGGIFAGVAGLLAGGAWGIFKK